ncbi:glycoside-pentoside-hexuronide (GPH):cation symporter [Bifidobacterium sp. 82T24]|uniref:MFS transporter n=1 Tax=Bifidobacterium pluvialisilvae TaxID=2834436 RepID=UPI001C5605A0|nr:glycoside-pentoside-hexuronide (GPH):cation symporter [Bifidobacterium pluvialisilvae]MBW3087195.1 glycoside-pentoside-hexuronide (GPH):cation symporter [Bifidobacterium pluvialisilvae]
MASATAPRVVSHTPSARNRDGGLSATAAPFGIGDKIGYMFGDVGNCFILSLVNGFVLKFYTDGLGIPAAIVGVTMMLTKVFDAFVDVYVGNKADESHAKPGEGRFRPWIRRFRYPFILVSILLFLPMVASWALPAKVAYIAVTYVLFNVFLSTVNIPYGALASALSARSDERASLSTYRSTGSAIANVATGYMIPMFMYETDANGDLAVSATHFLLIAIVCGALAYLSYEITIRLTTERTNVQTGRKLDARKMVTSMFKDRALLALIVADFFVVINQQLASINQTFLFDTYFHSKTGMAIAVMFNFITVLVLAPFATGIARRFGKRETSVATLAFAVVVYGIMYFAHLTDWRAYLVLMFFGAIGAGYFNLMVWAFITDVIDHHQAITKIREDGTIYGLNSWARKMGQTASNGISGILLGFIGYRSVAGHAVTQSAGTVEGVYALATLLPVVCLGIAALILAFWYPLGKKEIAETERILAGDRAKTEVEVAEG